MANDVNPVYGQLATVRQNLIDETTRLTENQVMNLVRPPTSNIAPDPFGSDAAYNRAFSLERAAIEAQNSANAMNVANRIAGQELAFRAVGAMGYAIPGLGGLIGGTILSEALPAMGHALGWIEDEPVVTLAEQTRAAVAQQIHRTAWDTLSYADTGGRRGISMAEAQNLGTELTSFMGERGLQGMEATRILPALEQAGLLEGVGSSGEMMKRIEEYIDALKSFVGKTQAGFEEIIGLMGMGATSGAGADQAASVVHSIMGMATYTGMDTGAVAQGMYGAAQPWMQSGMNYLPAVQAGASTAYTAILAERDFGGASFMQAGGGFQVGMMMQAMGSNYVANMSNRNLGAFIAGGQGFNQGAFETVMYGGDMPESALTAYDNLSTNNRAWATILGEQQMMARADDWSTFAMGNVVNQMVEDGYTNLATQALRLSETTGMTRAQAMSALQTYRAALDPNTGYRAAMEVANVEAQERATAFTSALAGGITAAAQGSAYIRNNSDLINLTDPIRSNGSVWEHAGNAFLTGFGLFGGTGSQFNAEEEAFADIQTMARASGANWNSRTDLLRDGDLSMFGDASLDGFTRNENWFNLRVLSQNMNTAMDASGMTDIERARIAPLMAGYINNMIPTQAGRQRAEGSDLYVSAQGIGDWLWNYNAPGVGVNQGAMNFGMTVDERGRFSATGDWGQVAFNQQQMADFMDFVTRISDPTATVNTATRAGTTQLDGMLYSIARDRQWDIQPTAQLQQNADQFNQAQRDYAFAMGQPSRDEYDQISATTFSPAGPDQSWINFTDKLGEADLNSFNSIVQNTDNASTATGRFQAYDALAQAVYGQGWESLNEDQQRNIQIQMTENHSAFALEDPGVVSNAASTLMAVASKYTSVSENMGPQAGMHINILGRDIDFSIEGRLRQEIRSRTGMSDERLNQVTQYGMLQQEYVHLSAGQGRRWEGEDDAAFAERQRRLTQVQDLMTEMGEATPGLVAEYYATQTDIASITQDVTGGKYTSAEVLVGGTLRRAQASAISELTGLGLDQATASTLVGGGTVDKAALGGLSDEAIAALPPNVQEALRSARTSGTLPSDFNIADLAAIGGGDFSLIGREHTEGGGATVRTGQTEQDATFVSLVVPVGGLPVVVAGFDPNAGGSDNNDPNTPGGNNS